MNRCCISLLICIGLHAHAVGYDDPADKRPLVCGPRCVRAILQHYGHDVPLTDLIKEMQNGIPEQGCSLQDIQSAFLRRGINCKAIKLGALDFPKWPQPVVLHYPAGHFVVLDETKGAFGKIRDGVSMRPTWKSIPKTMMHRPDAALLTSSGVIGEESGCVKWPARLALACSLGLVTGLAWFFIRRSGLTVNLFSSREGAV